MVVDFIGRELAIGDVVTFDIGSGGMPQLPLMRVKKISSGHLTLEHIVYENSSVFGYIQPQATCLVTSEYRDMPLDYVVAMFRETWFRYGANPNTKYRHELGEI
jgi:hypothetical protein